MKKELKNLKDLDPITGKLFGFIIGKIGNLPTDITITENTDIVTSITEETTPKFKNL